MPRGVYGKPLQENLRACSWHRSVLVKEGWEALGATETFWESLSGTFSKLPPAQMFYGSFLPRVCPSSGLYGLICLGTNSACDLPKCLANSCPGKSSLLSSPMKCWLRMGCLGVPAKAIAKGILGGIRIVDLFGDSALCFGWKGPACLGLAVVCTDLRLRLRCSALNLASSGDAGLRGEAEGESLSPPVLELWRKTCVKAPLVDKSTASALPLAHGTLLKDNDCFKCIMALSSGKSLPLSWSQFLYLRNNGPDQVISKDTLSALMFRDPDLKIRGKSCPLLSSPHLPSPLLPFSPLSSSLVLWLLSQPPARPPILETCRRVSTSGMERNDKHVLK